LFDAPAWGNPLEFLHETYLATTRDMELPYGQNLIILTSTVYECVTDGQTDGWTDRRAIAYTVLSIYAICCRALKISYFEV